MPTNRKSYNGAYEVPTKGAPEREMTNGNGGDTSNHAHTQINKSGGSSGGSSKPSNSKSEY